MSTDSKSVQGYNASEFVILECPPNISIPCTGSTDPSNTGMATVTTGEMASFSDTTLLICPNKIIRRTWVSSINGVNTDTCVQEITLIIDTISNNFQDIEQFSGFCSADIDSLVRDIFKLNCNKVFTNIITIPTSTFNCGNQQFFVTYNMADNCTGQTETVSQVFQMINIPPTTVANVVIDSAETSDGAIRLDVVICQESDLSYAWTDSSGMTVGTDSILIGVRAGDYNLEISSSAGCLDSFQFNIPQLGAVFLNCPQDVTLGCNEDINDQNITGIPTGSAGMMLFTDIMTQDCPVMIIERKWRLEDNGITLDSCIQTITIENNVTDISDTLRFTAMCPEPIMAFVQNIELQCSQTLDSSSIDLIMEDCRNATYRASYFISDMCDDISFVRMQTLEFNDIPFITMSDIQVIPDAGDSTGSISFAYSQCRSGDLTFAWSHGSNDTTLTMLPFGTYTLTITGPAMCVDSFTFTVPVLSDDVTCPADVTVSCDASTDPINLGVPMGGAVGEFTFSDTTIQMCPMTIIDRRWSRNMMTGSIDMCTQRITLDAAGVRANFPDTSVVTGVCGADLESFVDKNLPLSCGERVIDVLTVLNSTSCEEVVYTTTWFGANDCNGGASFTAIQVTIFRDIPVANLSNIMITPDPTGAGGAISFDAMACKADMLSYIWSNGSTDQSIDTINSGNYSVTITNEAGCTQVIDFVVPIFLSLTCPSDTTIDCEIEAKPSVTGMALVTGFDSISYFDIVLQECPTRITERRWIASISGGSLDTCLQVITQTDDNLRANFPDTVFISGQCSGMLDSLISGSLPMGCNERIDFVATDPISTSCDREIFRTDWLLFDECTGNRNTISQYTVFENLQIIQVSNEVISPAIGDSTGGISFDFASCKNDSVSFLWSNGSTAEIINKLASGTYTVTLTNTKGCMEVKSFDVPLSFALICPADIVISCAVMPDTSITGMAILQGFDTLTFIDTMIQLCPNIIIHRTFTGSSTNAESVSCTQIITLSNENVRSNFQDTIRISGACAADLATLVSMSPPLRCGESISSQNMTMSAVNCNSQTFQIDWFVFDECANQTSFLSQVTIFEDISVIDMTDFIITADQEDNSGAITYDFAMCMGDTVTFLWSNGATSPTITNVPGGFYGLTITNSIGCIDTFSYEIPLLFSLNCPNNISIACIQDPTTDITGFPAFTGYETISFVDFETQMCPDKIIERTFTAFTADSMVSETCRQIITLRDNSQTIRNGFPLMANLSGLCTDDVLANPASIFPLGCNEVLDSTSIVIASRGCEQDVVNFTWHITDMCKDTSFDVAQAVVFRDVPVITIDSLDIQGAQNGANGSITYSFTQCGNDTLSFIWNDLSTSPFLSNAEAGEYELRVTNARGCRDTFTFIVPTDLTVICPDDITISCIETPDTALTGVPLVFGFDDFAFSDVVVTSCPEMVIERTFISNAGTDTSSCVQLITLMNNDNIRDNFTDTISLKGLCPNDINTAVVDAIPLSCNESVDSTSIVMISESCMAAEAAVIWFISNACTGNASTVTQTVLFDSIPFVDLTNIMLTRDDGSGNGGVDFDIEFCENTPLSFDWSDGSSNKSLLGVVGGIYMVTVSNEVGCSEVFNFDVPAPLAFDSTKAMTVNIVNRDGDNFEDVSLRFLSNVGQEEIRADQFSASNGKYVYIVEGELSEVGFICPSFDDVAIRLVSSIDIVRGQRLILGISESCDEDFVAADVNFSGAPTAADLVLIRRVILGLDQNFPDSETWRFVKDGPIDLSSLKATIAGCIPLTQVDVTSKTIDLRGIKLGNLECPD
ncbi:MAG: dockerin type I repeat-containing protein [Saprospiraceae bacterium]